MLAGRYRLGEIVGRGGSAVVHRGFDRTLKRPVAVKLFSPYRPQAGDFAAAVLREARMAARLSHPNVARVYDYGEVVDGDERTPYLIMEFLRGETLADRLARTGGLEWRRAAEICAAIAAALSAAHEQESVHRDVKPRNIMLSPAGVKVLDFGIAAAAGQSSFDTRGRLWGTPAYLAPEQLRGEAAFPAVDVYALGLLLFECLTGRPAWKGETVGEILASRHDSPVPPLPRVEGVPREIIRLYRACTAAEPHRRPTAAAAADLLHRAAGTPQILRRAITTKQTVAVKQTVAAPRPARRRRRTALLASAAVVTALLSAAGLQFANAASTPSGRRAEIAVDGTRPAVASPRPSAASSSPTTEATQAPTHWAPVAAHTTTASTRHNTPVTTKPARSETTPPTTRPSKPATPSPSPSGPGSSPSATPTGAPSPTASDDPTTSPPPPAPTGSASPTATATADSDTA